MLARRTRLVRSVAVLATVAALAAGCGQRSDPATEPPVRGAQVQVLDNVFRPAHLEIAAGDTVTWTWEGRAAHDVVGEDFDSGVLAEGIFAHTFEAPGGYGYVCRLHPGMVGHVTVVAP